MQYPLVDVILLNWNGRGDTLECISSLQEMNYPNFRIVVVDNGSNDDSVSAIRGEWPDLNLIETGNNLGYAGGNNVGIRWSLEHGADYVFVLNNDTIVARDILNELVAASVLLENRAVLGAKILFYNSPETLCFGGARWDSSLGRLITLGWNMPDTAPFDRMTESAYANGCAIFVPSNIFKEVGLLDAEMFLIFEETDFCYRARKVGYKSWFVPGAKVWHKISASIGGSESPLARYFHARNQLIWGTRHLSLPDRLRLYRHILGRLRTAYWPKFVLPDQPGILPKRLLWASASWSRQLLRDFGSLGNKAEILGLMHFFRGRYGDCPQCVRDWNAEAKRIMLEIKHAG